MKICDHQCSGECRRSGCNCKCGEWHEEKLDAAEAKYDEMKEEDPTDADLLGKDEGKNHTRTRW